MHDDHCTRGDYPANKGGIRHAAKIGRLIPIVRRHPILLGAGCDKTPAPATVHADSPQDKAAATATVPSNPLKEAYFGEQHLHTAYSLDAYIGGARLTPDDAYRFAQGQEVTVGNIKVKLHAPLDWAAVTDHAEYIGEMYSTIVPGAPGHDQELLVQLRSLQTEQEREQWFTQYVVKNGRGPNGPQHPPFYQGPQTTVDAWKRIVAAAEANNQPGKFTTIPAFEFTLSPSGANLHRNILFRDTHVPDQPMSSIEIVNEEGLWKWLSTLEQEGMHVIAIPHNSNASKGKMFSEVDAAGNPINKAYAETRNHFEPLIEMMQIKGNSEVHRWFWSADEFANFENADSIGEFSDRDFKKYGKNSWVRYGVTKGLAFEQTLGVNPFHYGFVGGTDSHDALMANVAEDNFSAGSHGAADDTVEKRRPGEVAGWIKAKDENPGSITGVWATQNTREAIWDAMKIRETFATSGPRIQVRFFGRTGAWDKPADMKSLVEAGYAKGVPMGGTLKGPSKDAPSFTVWAVREPDGANLDRIQIVKGWVDAKGEPYDEVYDVV